MADGVWTSRRDREDGSDLRHLAFDGDEIIARIMFAVRDPLWRTLPLLVVDRDEEQSAGGFRRRIRARVDAARSPLVVELEAEASGRSLRVHASARALDDFEYARIGLNVLISTADYAGCDAVLHQGPVRSPIVFPPSPVARRENMDAASAAFHESFDRVDVEHPSGVGALIRFGGSLFEFEDQRAWTDRSFKAYSVSDGWPFRAVRGEEFRQSLELEARRFGHRNRRDPSAAPFELEIADAIGSLSPVGVAPGERHSGEVRPAGGLAELLAGPSLDSAVRLPVNGAVHAADHESVGESALVHGEVVRAAKRLVHGSSVTLDPVAFLDAAGDWRDGHGRFSAAIPAGAERAGWGSAFAGAWVVASVASAAPAQPAGMFYFGPELPERSSARSSIERLSRMVGWTVHPVRVAWPLVGLVLVPPGHSRRGVLVVANIDRDRVAVRAPGKDLQVEGFQVIWLPVSDEFIGDGDARREWTVKTEVDRALVATGLEWWL